MAPKLLSRSLELHGAQNKNNKQTLVFTDPSTTTPEIAVAYRHHLRIRTGRLLAVAGILSLPTAALRILLGSSYTAPFGLPHCLQVLAASVSKPRGRESGNIHGGWPVDSPNTETGLARLIWVTSSATRAPDLCSSRNTSAQYQAAQGIRLYLPRCNEPAGHQQRQLVGKNDVI